MTWPAPRKSRRVPIRPACPILTIRSTCRSIRPSRPSTCSIIRGARPSRSASTCSSSIPAAGCASSTISLCEYALPFPAENDVVVSLFTFPRRNARRYFSPAICKNTNLHKDLSGEHVHGPVHRQELDVGRHEGKTPHRRPLLFPLRRTSILASWPLTPGVPQILDNEDFLRPQSNIRLNQFVYRAQIFDF